MGFWSEKAKSRVRQTAKLRRINALAKLPEDDLEDECFRRADRLQETLFALHQKGISCDVLSDGSILRG